MEKLVWTDLLSIGNENIDADHKRLIEICNELIDLEQRENKLSDYARILSKLTDYALLHFKKEEQYMKSIGYPDIETHKGFHRTFTRQIAIYNKDLLSNHPPEPLDIVLFIKDWFKNHIQVFDREYEQFRKDEGVVGQYDKFW